MNASVKGYILLFTALFIQKIDTFAFSFSPAQGKAGDTVTITLNTPLPADTSGLVVYFSPFIKAQIIQANDVTVKTIVPIGAVSGNIKVTIDGLIYGNAIDFSVIFNSNKGFNLAEDLTAVATRRDGNFLTSPFPSGRNVYGVAADFDGDGKVDYATAPSRYSGISVLRNNVPLIYDPTRIINETSFDRFSTNLPSNDSSLYHLTVCDINADGKPDIVGVSNITNGIYIYINESTIGNIRFEDVLRLDAKTNKLSQVLCADMNNDNKPDIVAVSFDSSLVSIHINQSINQQIEASSFIDTVIYLGQQCRPGAAYGFNIADLNNNQLNDLVIVNYCLNRVILFINQSISAQGFPVFDIPQLIPVSRNPVNIVIADYNNDNKLDMVVSHQDTVITIIQHQGFVNNQFQFSTSTLVNRLTQGENVRGYWGIAAVDINGDNKKDIVSTAIFTSSATGSQRLVVMNINNSSGNISFLPREGILPNENEFITISGLPQGITVADLNFDGRPDLLVNDYTDFSSSSGSVVAITNRFGFPTSLRKTESTNQLAAGNRLHFYPNPAKTIIQFDDLPSQTEISIYTMYGRMVLTTQVQADKTIDVQYLPIGTYLIKVHTSGQYGVLIKE